MSKTMIQEWINALESGLYKQTRLVLKDADGYCCLGVALEIHAPELLETLKEKDQYLPNDFRKKLGITKEDMEYLTRMNDADRKTFKAIAQWLREKYV